MKALNPQSGNVLFYILIAVALLAALSYAVSNSGRSNTNFVNDERARLAASEIIEYSNVMLNAVTQTKLRGYTDTEISFKNDTISGYDNPNCTEYLCEILNVNGGGIILSSPPIEALDSSHASNAQYAEYVFTKSTPVEGIGDDATPDLTISLNYISENVCIWINKLLDVQNPSNEPPIDMGSSNPFSKFDGTYTSASPYNAPELAGKTSGCFQNSTQTINTFYKVLIAR